MVRLALKLCEEMAPPPVEYRAKHKVANHSRFFFESRRASNRCDDLALAVSKELLCCLLLSENVYTHRSTLGNSSSQMKRSISIAELGARSLRCISSPAQSMSLCAHSH